MKSVLYGLLGIIFVAAIVWFGIRFFSGNEDTWICQNGEWVKHGNPSASMPETPCLAKGEITLPTQTGSPKATNGANMVNPASKNCVDKGGQLAIVKETAGELGICKFPDGSQCEEWQFFRNECKKGQTTSADTSHPYSGIIRKEGFNYILRTVNGVNYTLKLASDASVELKNRLQTESLSKQTVAIVASETPLLSKILLLKSFQNK